MSFLSPAFLLALPLIAAPVIIHLLSRRRREIIQWGAMDFLMGSATPRRRLFRLRDLLLLLLRVLALLALIGALSRPVLNLPWLPQTGSRDVILVLDMSMSTGRRTAGATLLERQIDEAMGILGRLNDTDRARVLLAGPSPRWMQFAPEPVNAEMRNRLARQLRELQPALGPAEIHAALQEALRAPAAGADWTRMIAVLTDGQAHGWGANDSAGWDGIRERIESAAHPVAINVRIAQNSGVSAENLAVERVELPRGYAAPDETVILTASVKNFGTTPSEAALFSWWANGQSLGVSTVPPLEPGAAARVSFTSSFLAPGVKEIKGRLERDDPLPLDNEAVYLLEIVDSLPILIVERDRLFGSDGASFLLAALGYESNQADPRWPSIFRPVLGNGREIPSEVKCVVIPHLREAPDDFASNLAAFVENGGGVWLGLGEETDSSWFNRVFYRNGAGLSPARLIERAGSALDRENFFLLRAPFETHPATRLLADFERIDLDRARIYERHQFHREGLEQSRVLLAVEQGHPLAVEKIFGRGRVIVQGIPLNADWSNLPLCQAYVTLVHEWLWYLAEPMLTQRNLHPGEPLRFSPSETNGSMLWLRRSGAEPLPLFPRERNDRAEFRHNDTFWPGIYTISGTGISAGQSMFQVRRDPMESDLAPLTEAEMNVLSEAGLKFGEDPLAHSRIAGRQSHPISDWLLLVLLLALVVELILAGWFSQRKSSPITAEFWKTSELMTRR